MPRSKGKSSLRKKLLVTTVATVVSLVACEVTLRMFFKVPFSPFLREYDEVMGMSYKKNLHATLEYPEFTAHFSTNSRGFRGPEPPPPTKGCILIFGDSYSEGWGVSDGEEYASLLRDAMDERYGKDVVPVINTSMSATGQGRWIKLLRSVVNDYEPRLVLFQTCWNDSMDNLREGMFRVVGYQPYIGATLTRSQLLERADEEPPSFRALQTFFEAVPGLEQSRLFALIRNAFRRQTERDYWRLDADEPSAEVRQNHLPPQAVDGRWLYKADHLFLALLEHCFAICRERGWPTALLSVRTGDTRFGEMVKLAERFDAPVLDIRNRVAHPEFYYEEDSHWNQAGHKDIARMILERLLAPDSVYLHGLTPRDPAQHDQPGK